MPGPNPGTIRFYQRIMEHQSLTSCIAKRLHHRSLIRTRQQVNLELARCIQDPVYWCNQWVWTYAPKNPIEGQMTLPFMLFPKQADLIRWIEEREKASQSGLDELGIVEKSRDTGITWVCCVYAAHAFLFKPEIKISFGSRKLDLVDDLGVPDSIFEKIRFLLRNLPTWMLPAAWNEKKHASFCKIINADNGATIIGEGGDELGRGGRSSLYFLDEAAKIERPLVVEGALSGNWACRIDVATPNGMGNPFAEKRFSGKFSVFTFHWTDDPRKTPEWAEHKKNTTHPAIWAAEYDVDYAASLEGICIPAAWVRAAVGLLHPIHYATGPVLAGLDVSEFGEDLNVFIARQGPVVREPISWSGKNTTESAHIAREYAVKAKVEQVCYDCVGIGAGIRGTWLSSESELPFEATAVNTGESPTDVIWPDNKTSKEKFLNLRAELWWKLRQRFEKAYEHKNGLNTHPVDELISLPNHPQLIAELSLPLIERTETGKLRLESKANMKRRGVKSPNYADALALAFHANGDQWKLTSRIPKNLMETAPRGTWIDEIDDDMTSRIERMGW